MRGPGYRQPQREDFMVAQGEDSYLQMMKKAVETAVSTVLTVPRSDFGPPPLHQKNPLLLKCLAALLL
jgi:hypothetical protein